MRFITNWPRGDDVDRNVHSEAVTSVTSVANAAEECCGSSNEIECTCVVTIIHVDSRQLTV